MGRRRHRRRIAVRREDRTRSRQQRSQCEHDVLAAEVVHRRPPNNRFSSVAPEVARVGEAVQEEDRGTLAVIDHGEVRAPDLHGPRQRRKVHRSSSGSAAGAIPAAAGRAGASEAGIGQLSRRSGPILRPAAESSISVSSRRLRVSSRFALATQKVAVLR